MPTSVRGSQRPEGGTNLGGEEFRLLPGREVVALVDCVEVDEVGVGLLGPAPRRLIELPRKHAHGGRDGDALDVEEAERVLPVETTRGNPCVRHPRERDVELRASWSSIQAARATGESASP